MQNLFNVSNPDAYYASSSMSNSPMSSQSNSGFNQNMGGGVQPMTYAPLTGSGQMNAFTPPANVPQIGIQPPSVQPPANVPQIGIQQPYVPPSNMGGGNPMDMGRYVGNPNHIAQQQAVQDPNHPMYMPQPTDMGGGNAFSGNTTGGSGTAGFAAEGLALQKRMADPNDPIYGVNASKSPGQFNQGGGATDTGGGRTIMPIYHNAYKGGGDISGEIGGNAFSGNTTGGSGTAEFRERGLELQRRMADPNDPIYGVNASKSPGQINQVGLNKRVVPEQQLGGDISRVGYRPGGYSDAAPIRSVAHRPGMFKTQ